MHVVIDIELRLNRRTNNELSTDVPKGGKYDNSFKDSIVYLSRQRKDWMEISGCGKKRRRQSVET